MSGCGANDFQRGGTLIESTISSALVQGSTISASVLDSSKITNLTGMDELSAMTVASALAALTPDQLAVLARAISSAMPNTEAGARPAEVTGDSLPTTIVGRRTLVLGEPTGWLTLNGLVVPAYESKQCGESVNG